MIQTKFTRFTQIQNAAWLRVPQNGSRTVLTRFAVKCSHSLNTVTHLGLRGRIQFDKAYLLIVTVCF